MYTMIAKRFGVDKLTDPVVSALFTQDQWDPVMWNNAMETVHQTAYNTWAASVAIAPLNPPTWARFQVKSNIQSSGDNGWSICGLDKRESTTESLEWDYIWEDRAIILVPDIH